MSLVLDNLRTHARARPESVALSGGGASLTYAALPAAIEAAAGALDAILPAGGAPAAVALDNGPAWAVVDLALVSLGRPALPLPPFFTAAQTAHALADCGAAAMVRPAREGEAPDLVAAGVPLAVERLDRPARPLHAGTAKITYTSGSTGAAKGVCLSQAQMEATAEAVVRRLGAGMAGLHLPLLPLGVLLENVAGLYPTLIAGGRYHAPGLAALGFADPFRPDLARLAGALAEARPTSLILVPELLRLLMALTARGAVDPSSLRFVAVGGARVSPDLVGGARALGIPVHEGYGLSECASVVALNAPGADRTGSVGLPLDHAAVALAPDGEVIVAGSAFLGYVGGPPHEGPVRTGDLGSLDADGFLRIDGRKANTIITSFGRNVAPEWVEAELLAEPAIGQAVVFGEAQAALSALLVPASPDLAPGALAAAVARANARLPAYARVGAWRAGAPLDAAAGEVTPNGRPRREVIRARRPDLFETQETA